MANKTVYPYGTQGTLPASIGVINDLTTGGADKALAAQQGVVLLGKMERDTAVDLSTMGIIHGVLVSGGSWSGVQTNHESVQVPVLPGQTYRITANAVNNSFYAFFTAFSAWSASGTPNYSTGHAERYRIDAGETSEITIPDDAYFLYLAITNNSSDQKPQSVILVEVPSEETGDNGELRKEIVGTQANLCDYATDSFSFTGTSAQGKVEKVGVSGYLLSNIASTSGKYFIYELPEGMEDGKTYLLSFDYKSWLSANWNMNVVRAESQNLTSPQRSYQIPATGSGHLSFRYTYLNGDTYLRLASTSQNADCFLLIENLSIVPDVDTVAGLTQRLDLIDGGQSMGTHITYNKYFGRRIDTAEHGFGYAEYMDSVTTHQSSACYGDYLFVFMDKMATVKMYNIKTRTALATFTQTALDSYHHCNQAFFGTEKYDEDDVFPLVYLTVNNNGTTAGGYMEAYRIVPTMGDSDYSSFTITLVQTVTLPIMTSDNALGNANFVLDADSGYLFTYSRNTIVDTPGYHICRITKWPMPKLSDGNVTFTDADRLDYWNTDTEAVNMQGASIMNHQLFIFRGGSGVGYTEIHVFDLVRRDRIAFIDLLSNGFTMEPEGVFFWGNTLCTSNTKVYRFFFR